MESVSNGVGSASGTDGLKAAVTIDTEKVRGHLDEVVRSTVEATLNQLLDEEADRIAGAGHRANAEFVRFSPTVCSLALRL